MRGRQGAGLSPASVAERQTALFSTACTPLRSALRSGADTAWYTHGDRMAGARAAWTWQGSWHGSGRGKGLGILLQAAAHWKNEATSGSTCARGRPTRGTRTATIAFGACRMRTRQASKLLEVKYRPASTRVAQHTTQGVATWQHLIGCRGRALEDREERQRHHDQQRDLCPRRRALHTIRLQCMLSP